MKVIFLLCCALIPCCVSGYAQAPKPEKGSAAEKKVVDLRFTPDPALPNVLLLGDSISIGYHAAVREALRGKANVFRPVNPKNGAAENCSDSGNGVAKLEGWLALQPKWDVVHFNWGLHDIKHVKPGTTEVSSEASDPSLRTVSEYAANLEGIVSRLEKTGAKLIFCTTTPVAPETKGPFRRDEDVVQYNGAALKAVGGRVAAVDDLYVFTKPQLEKVQLPNNVHFSAEGSKVLGDEVARVISANLPPR